MRPFLPRIVLPALGALLFVAHAQAEPMTLDGRLVEAAWDQAVRLEDFVTVMPLTREMPEVRTQAWVLAKEEGLYFGFRCEQPASVPRTRHPTTRDVQARADRLNVMIDFDGRGVTAYELTVSLSGGIQDAQITGQNQYNYDWDGRWEYAVAEDSESWSVEMRLPWSLAAQSGAVEGQRQIGLYLSRFVEATGRRYSIPGYDFEHPTFVADMRKLSIPAFSQGRWSVVPYLAISDDRLNAQQETRIGADLFWSPNSQHQLSLAVQPDFGQVESDDLVVNFNAIETFFSEKRPFFTENQALFNVPVGNGALLINTRRIGAAPDAGSAGVSDVDVAAKYTGSSNRMDWGVLLADEADTLSGTTAASGRSFHVLRGRWRSDQVDTGYTLTHVDRPSLARESWVQVVDSQWKPVEGLVIRGALGNSRIEQAGSADRQGGLAWIRADWAQSERLRQEYEFNRYSRHLQLNDFGYLPRADLEQYRAEWTWYTRSHGADSALRNSAWELELLWQQNTAGQRVLGDAELSHLWHFQSNDALKLMLVPQLDFVDDLITRGHGYVTLPGNHAVGLEYEGRHAGWTQFNAELWVYREGLRGRVWELYLEPTFFLSEKLTTTLGLDVLDSSNWLIWDGDDRLATYARRKLELDWTLNWFPAPKHEIRLRTQFVGLSADAQQTWRAVAGQLVSDERELRDFSLGHLAAQLRYRYEFGPQRELYLVFSRGGEFEDDAGENGYDRLFDLSRANVTASQVMAKLRWAF